MSYRNYSWIVIAFLTIGFGLMNGPISALFTFIAAYAAAHVGYRTRTKVPDLMQNHRLLCMAIPVAGCAIIFAAPFTGGFIEYPVSALGLFIFESAMLSAEAFKRIEQ